MNLKCAYCEQELSEFLRYKLHLKVYHNKRTYSDRLLCGQNGCPRDFTRFQTLKQHIIKVHNVSCDIDRATDDESCNQVSDCAMETVDDRPNCSCTEPSEDTTTDYPCDRILQENFDERGVFYDAALLVSRLQSNPKIALSSVNDIVQTCTEMLAPTVVAVKEQVRLLVDQHDVPVEKTHSLLKVLDVMENPFVGIDTTWKQSKYLMRNGYYVEPQSFLIDSYILPGEAGCRVKKITGEFISTTKVLQQFLSLPGVLTHVKSHLEASTDDSLICDFRDGQLWKEHPVRLQHASDENTVVIPIFDFYDDLETTNPLGSHSVIHKVGVKYTVVKGFSPAVNSKLENIILNMVFNASERTAHGIFENYLNEMTKLEREGFSVTDEAGVLHQVYVVLVQVIGDNLGLNGLLGYVEGFTANYPCRICKTARENFNETFSESEDCLRSCVSYNADLALHDPSLTGIKDVCVYNTLPSYHVTDNVYCDIMHDVAEGVCRYVVPLVLHSLVFRKKYFSLDVLNERLAAFVFDHSSAPPSFSADSIKRTTINISAVEMLNLVLGLNLMVGDLVPHGDSEWEIYLMLRHVVLYCCGLMFSEAELEYFRIVVAEFLQEYRSVFQGTLTLKFHNMIHYPRVIKTLGPLYHMWVMRCEAKHAELKKAAQSAGNFKNISKTLAKRHQLRQAERFMTRRGFEVDYLHLPSGHLDTVVLAEIEGGSRISSLLGNYGMFRELFSSDSVSVGSVCYRTNDVLVCMEDESDLHPSFLKIQTIYMTDNRECFFVCTRFCATLLDHHFQAYEVVDSTDMKILSTQHLQQLPSPWPLKLRTVNNVQYISLRHKL